MRPLAGVVCAFMIAATAAGQGVTVRGLVFDSLHSRPLGGAFVSIGGNTTTTDSTGRFSIRVVPGSYRITAQHDVIDGLGMSAVGTQAVVTNGREPITVSVPSFAALWRLECGPTPPPRDTGFIFGTVRSSRARARARASVSASWIDLAANGTKISQKLRTLEVTADPRGNFSLCGVPTTTGLTIQASTDSVHSGSFDLGPMDRERVMRRDLVMFDPSSMPRAAFAGKVVADSGGEPLPKTEVMIIDLGLARISGDQGEFRFDSIPPGSHRVYVRRIGYAEVELGIDFQSGEQIDRDIVMTRITILDSMPVTAKPLARDEAMRVFEEHRKLGLGKFLTQAQLDSANGRTLSQMMVMFPSLTIELDPKTSKHTPSFIGRGPKSLVSRGRCLMAVYVDGALDRDPDLNAYPPGAIAGVEYYRGAAQTPIEYAKPGSVCGVIVINLRKK